MALKFQPRWPSTASAHVFQPLMKALTSSMTITMMTMMWRVERVTAAMMRTTPETRSRDMLLTVSLSKLAYEKYANSFILPGL